MDPTTEHVERLCYAPGQEPGALCDEDIFCKGLCKSHHRMWLRTGKVKALRLGPARVQLHGTRLRVKKEIAKRYEKYAAKMKLTVSEVARSVLEGHAPDIGGER